MGKIIKKLRVCGERAEARLRVLFDSGAGSSLIRESVARKLGAHFTPIPVPRRFRGVNGTEAFQSGRTCTLVLEMKGKLLDGSFYIVEQMPREIIVGVDFMQKWEIKLDLKQEDYRVGVDPEAIEIA